MARTWFKKARERFQEHEQSHAHSEERVKFSALKQSSVAAQLSTKIPMDQESTDLTCQGLAV